MSRNGSGTYSLPQAAFVAGTTIAASPMNSDLSDIAAALTQSISKDGQTTYTGNQPMGSNKLTGLAAGTALTDSVTLGQVVAGAILYGTASGTDTVTLTLTPSPGAYAVGQRFSYKVANTNTGAVTVNANTIGAGPLVWPNGTALVAGDTPANAMVVFQVQDITSPTAPVLHLQSVSVPPVFRTGGTMTGTLVMSSAAINEYHGADIASATTINLTTATGNFVDVTGTTTITTVTLAEGYCRTVRFTGALILTNGANLVLPGAANITTAAGDYAVFRGVGSSVTRCESYIKRSGAPILMSPITDSLTGDVDLNNTATYFTGPTIAQGTAGVWFVAGKVTVLDTAGAATFSAKLWDGTTVIDSGTDNSTGANAQATISLSGYISAPAGNLRISVVDGTSTSGKIKFNSSGNSKDSTITAIRIA